MCCALMMKGSVGQGTITTFQESAYSSQFQVVWQPNNVWISNQGQVLELVVTEQSGELAAAHGFDHICNCI
jgi:hypothetical protein